MSRKPVPKAAAVASASVGAVGTVATMFIVIPPEVVVPWYGYLIAGTLNGVIGFVFVYFASKNPK